MVKKTISAAESAEQVQVSEAVRARAARQAAQKRVVNLQEDHVDVRVTKMGSGKVSMGIHAAPFGDAYHEQDEALSVPQSVADNLEARGFAEIQVAKAPRTPKAEEPPAQ